MHHAHFLFQYMFSTGAFETVEEHVQREAFDCNNCNDCMCSFFVFHLIHFISSKIY